MTEINAIDGAAAAFQADMNPGATPSRAPASTAQPVERMFDHFDNDYEDEDAGDDTTIVPKVDPKVTRKPARPEAEPEGDGEDEGDGDGDEEVEGDGDGEVEEPEVEEDGEDESPEVKAFYDTKVEITVDGKVEDVSVREALKGYIRTETFHRRLNQVNEAATQVGEEARKVATNRDRYAAMNGELEATLKELMPAEPDWDKLFAENPAEAHKLKKQYDDYKGKLATLQTNRQKAMEEKQEETKRNTQAFATSEFGKFIHNNRIEDPKVLEKEIASMRKTGLAAGFSEAEIATVYDSRMLTVLRKASKYDRMMASKPKAIIPDKGKTLVPGNGKSGSSTVRNGYSQAQKQLARTGSLDDATDFFRKFTR